MIGTVPVVKAIRMIALTLRKAVVTVWLMGDAHGEPGRSSRDSGRSGNRKGM
jgi:hypothetical protein